MRAPSAAWYAEGDERSCRARRATCLGVRRKIVPPTTSWTRPTAASGQAIARYGLWKATSAADTTAAAMAQPRKRALSARSAAK